MEEKLDSLVEKHSGLVRRIVQRVTAVTGFDDRNDELFQYGVQGLLEAASRYDPSKGAAFSTFAWYRIQGAIYDGMRAMHPVRRSQTMDQRFAASVQGVLGQAAAEMAQELRDGHADPMAEMERLLSEATTVHLCSLDAMQEPLVDDAATDIDAVIHAEELETYLSETLQRLPDLERSVVSQHYYENKGYAEIAASLGRSKAYVCRVHRKAIQRLGSLLGRLLEVSDQ